MIGATFTVAGAQSAKPKADDVGITGTEIRLAVIADVDTPVAPGVFKASVDAMNAWAKVVNKAGGIAGRKVVIDFIDSKLNPNETRNAIIKACADDFAMVGGEALFVNNVDDMVACKNAAGKAIGIPDVPGLALDPAQQCSPVSYTIIGRGPYCATKNDHPQTYIAPQGDALYYLKKNKDLHGIWTVPADLKSTKNSLLPTYQAARRPRHQEGRERLLRRVPARSAERDDPGRAGDQGEQLDLRVQRQQQDARPAQGGDHAGRHLGEGVGLHAGVLLPGLRGPGRQRRRRHPERDHDVAVLHGVQAEPDAQEARRRGRRHRQGRQQRGGLLARRAPVPGRGRRRPPPTAGRLSRQTLFDALKQEHQFDANGIMGPTDVANHMPPGVHRDDAGEERQAGSHVPDEARHLRLQQEEPGRDQDGPQLRRS